MSYLEFVHIGDSHFVKGPRFGECVRINSEWTVDTVRRIKPTALLHGGDLSDRTTTPEIRLAEASMLEPISEVCPIYMAAGNHDPWKDLRILDALKPGRIHVCDTAGVYPLGDVGIAMMAWPRLADAANEGAAQDAVRAVLGGLRAPLSAFRHRLLLGHFATVGAIMGAGQPMRGSEVTVSLSDLSLAGAHAVLMSHIHKAQEWVYDGVPMIYAGSQYRTDFGETEAKSITVVRIEGDKVTWERIPTPAREMHLATGKFDPATMTLSNSHAETNVRGADVRFVYETPREHLVVARAMAADIEKRWRAEGAASVDVDYGITSATRVTARAPEVARAATLPAKVQALWTNKNDVPEPWLRDRVLANVAQLEDSRLDRKLVAS